MKWYEDPWWKGNELRKEFVVSQRNFPREVRKGWEKEYVLVPG